MGGGIPMAGGAVNAGAGGVGFNANGFGGGLGMGERLLALSHPTTRTPLVWD